MEATSLRLEEYRQLASESEREIIDFVISHPNKAVGASIHELADLTCTSASTIARLCKKLGLNGYRAFQRGLIAEHAISRQGGTVAASEGITNQDSTETIIQKATAKNISSLELTGHLLDAAKIDEAVDLMCSAKSIRLFGVGASLMVAHDLELKLLRLNVNCLLSDDSDAQLLYAKNMSKEDVAVVISYSGQTPSVNRCAHIARDKGARVIAITRGGFDSELANNSDCILGVAATEMLKRSGAMSSRIAQLNVVDVLFLTYVRQTWDTSVRRVSSNFIIKVPEGA